MDNAEQLMQVLEERVAGPTDIAVMYELQTFSVGTEVLEERYTVYDSIGRAVAGWVEDDGGWYYIDGNGNYASGWRSIDGNTYYFDTSTKYMVHGWLLSGGYYYYMGYPGAPDTGAMYMSGWLNDTEGGGTASDPLWYYLDTDGTMRHGWLYDGGYYYYMGYPGAPLSGVMYNHGWMEDTDGTWYYFDSDGIMQTGWLLIDAKYYYLDENNGKMSVGSDTINGKTYLFDSQGVCINRNPPSSDNNMTYNFTFYLEANSNKMISTKNSMVSYFNLMGYPGKQIISCNPKDTYAQWPYDKITIVHGHGEPGHTQYVVKYEDEANQEGAIDNNWLISSRNWTYTGQKNEPVYTADERVISDYVENQLDNNLFTLFISCYSAARHRNLTDKDEVTGETIITGTRTVDRSSIEATYDAGAKCGL